MLIPAITDDLFFDVFANRVRTELEGNILPFWERFGRDELSGGFYGFLDNDNRGDPLESRSIVMTARHLWAYSSAASLLGDSRYLEMADYAWRAISRDFIDGEFGGVFWSVRPDGTPDVAKKQIYGEAFALYGLSAYAIALKKFRPDTDESADVLDISLSLFGFLEAKARDHRYGGYVEALARDWGPTGDRRLSGKDIDCAKSMNANLHVLEAYAACRHAVRVVRPEWSDVISRLGDALSGIVSVMTDRILGKDFHLGLYFNADWTPIGDAVSYGHDIEASWLLWEAVEELSGPGRQDHELASRVRPIVVAIAETALREGFDAVTGGMESELRDGKKDRTRVWWCQAESLVGFFNAWQLTGERKFLEACVNQWDWIEDFQRDRTNGEWFWAVDPAGRPDFSKPKGGNWKASYHNARCCMEILNRLDPGGFRFRS